MTKKAFQKYPVQAVSLTRPYAEIRKLFDEILNSPAPVQFKLVPLMILSWVLMMRFSKTQQASDNMQDYKAGINALLKSRGQLPIPEPPPPSGEPIQEVIADEQE